MPRQYLTEDQARVHAEVAESTPLAGVLRALRIPGRRDDPPCFVVMDGRLVDNPVLRPGQACKAPVGRVQLSPAKIEVEQVENL